MSRATNVIASLLCGALFVQKAYGLSIAWMSCLWVSSPRKRPSLAAEV